jgi:hypothetical protein
MAEHNIRVRADLNPDAIQVENDDHDDGNQDPPNPPQKVGFYQQRPVQRKQHWLSK